MNEYQGGLHFLFSRQHEYPNAQSLLSTNIALCVVVFPLKLINSNQLCFLHTLPCVLLSPFPTKPVELPGKVVDLRSGFSHAVAILENGDVYTWGKMQGTAVKTGRQGVSVYEDQLYPRKVDVVGGGRAMEAFCSSFNTLLKMEDGRVLMSGLEADTRKTVLTPVEVRGREHT